MELGMEVPVFNNIEVYSDVNELAQRLREMHSAGNPAYLRFEIMQKKSMLMINPAANELFYVDRLGRPLLKDQSDTILGQLPAQTKLVDISRLEAEKNIYNRAGFHANQPVFDDSAWLNFAKQQIEKAAERTRTVVAEQPTEKAERFQTAAPLKSKLNSFFGREKPATQKPAPDTTFTQKPRK
jgi:hypothetical protein